MAPAAKKSEQPEKTEKATKFQWDRAAEDKLLFTLLEMRGFEAPNMVERRRLSANMPYSEPAVEHRFRDIMKYIANAPDVPPAPEAEKKKARKRKAEVEEEDEEVVVETKKAKK